MKCPFKGFYSLNCNEELNRDQLRQHLQEYHPVSIMIAEILTRMIEEDNQK